MKRREIVEAAKQGIFKLIEESKDPDLRGVRIVDTPRGFCVVYLNGDRVYFDTLEI